MSSLQRTFIGTALIFVLSICGAYSADYFPYEEGSYWKFDWRDLYQHGGGSVDIKGTATWTVSKIQGETVTIDRKMLIEWEKAQGEDGNYENVYDPPKEKNDELTLNDDGNVISNEKGIWMFHDPDGSLPDPSSFNEFTIIDTTVLLNGNQTDAKRLWAMVDKKWRNISVLVPDVGFVWLKREHGFTNMMWAKKQYRYNNIYELKEAVTIIRNPSMTNNGKISLMELVIGKNAITIVPSKEAANGYDVALIDAAGRQVFSREDIPAENTVIKTQNLAAGVYYLKVRNRDGMLVRKILLSR